MKYLIFAGVMMVWSILVAVFFHRQGRLEGFDQGFLAATVPDESTPLRVCRNGCGIFDTRQSPACPHCKAEA